MGYLFLVALGPVQEFIASARRTRDLQFGSWFLSELSRAAAREIDEQHGKLIFPAPQDKAWLKSGDSFNVANRILALVDQEESKKSPEELAVEVREAVDEQLDEIKRKAFENKSLTLEQQTVADKQIKDLVEFVWVALPLPDVEKYQKVRNQLEELMAARKNTHAFASVKWGSNVPKSSIDGLLESVIAENEFPSRTATADQKRQAIQRLYNLYNVAGPAERLSGVDLLKRLGKTAFDKHFPSTSHFATLPFLQRMRHIKSTGLLHSAWLAYIKKLDSLAVIPLREQINFGYPSHPILDRYDGSLLFEGRLSDVLLLPSEDDAVSKEKLRGAKEAQQTFYEALDKEFQRMREDKKRPYTYYALLQADGDNMGKLIDALAHVGYEQHIKLSQILSGFAEGVRKIVVDDYQGALIYAGGDDVLAFLPLHTVLECAYKLQATFYKALEDLAKPVECDPPTLSVGIAIVHQLESLGEVRRLAREAEQRAKQQDGKNSLAITVSKRSGEDYRIVGSWGNIDVRLSKLVEYFRDAHIPAGMAYELRDMVLRLTVSHKDLSYDLLQEIIRVEALRILMRKLTVPAGKLPPAKIKEVEAFLRAQLSLPPKGQEGQKSTEQNVNVDSDQSAQDETNKAPGLPPVSVEMFINELVIAQMLAEAADLALM